MDNLFPKHSHAAAATRPLRELRRWLHPAGEALPGSGGMQRLAAAAKTLASKNKPGKAASAFRIPDLPRILSLQSFLLGATVGLHQGNHNRFVNMPLGMPSWWA